MEYPTLGGTHKECHIQLLAPYRIAVKSTVFLRAFHAGVKFYAIYGC